jgi:deoxyribodipyrimidine photo-lyase
MDQIFAPNRAEALTRLGNFLPDAGQVYADDRNYDHGPERRGNVSVLSPYIRHRLITESEVVAAVLQQHSLQAAEKYVQEVLWRTYWKGWLEMRPGVWLRYNQDLAQQVEALDRNGGMARDYRAAIEGRTGIEGFDDWAQELTETGYLHNHARMWFASIWIFTLGLPWQLGADFFYRHLLDGDPASNTLSWRWVAGLQTKGKTYAASRDNIKKYTGGRFSPSKELARHAVALDEPAIEGARPLALMPDHYNGEAAVLLTEEDYGIETLPIDWSRIGAVAVADLTNDRTDRGVDERVAAFGRASALDTIHRLKGFATAASIVDEPMSRIQPNDILPWLQKSGLKTLLIPETPVGPSASAVASLSKKLMLEGISVVRVRRTWDSKAWPHATKGFFAFKEQIPALLRSEGLM